MQTITPKSASGQKRKIVIGVPGLLDRNESGRISDLFEVLKKRDCLAYDVPCSSVKRNGLRITCEFDLEKYQNDVGNVVNRIYEENKEAQIAIGAITSSVGAAAFIKYLASSEGAQLKKDLSIYTAISPFTLIHPDAKRKIEQCIKFGKDLPIGTNFDAEKRIERIIPPKNLGNILDINVILEIQRMNLKNPICPVLTLLGKEDDRVDTQSIRDYHAALKGTKLVEYDCGHNIPHDESKLEIIAFFEKHFL